MYTYDINIIYILMYTHTDYCVDVTIHLHTKKDRSFRIIVLKRLLLFLDTYVHEHSVIQYRPFSLQRLNR